MKVGWMAAVDPMEFWWIYGVTLVIGSLLREAAKTTVSEPEPPQAHYGSASSGAVLVMGDGREGPPQKSSLAVKSCRAWVVIAPGSNPWFLYVGSFPELKKRPWAPVIHMLWESERRCYLILHLCPSWLGLCLELAC